MPSSAAHISRALHTKIKHPRSRSTKPIVRGPRRWAEAAGADRQILDGPARSAPQPRLQIRPTRKDYA